MVSWKTFWPFAKKSFTTEDLLRELFGAQVSRSGASINWKTALDVTTVFRCVKVLSDCISTVPLRIYQKDPVTGVRTRSVDHPLVELFDVAPNEWQDSLQFRETVSFHLALGNNAYVFINRVRGRIVELIPLEPAKVSITQNPDYSLTYKITAIDGSSRDFPQETIWHIRGPSWDGWRGLDSVRMAREAIGLAVALEGSHAALHRNGVRASGAYTVEGSLSDDQYKKLKAYIKASLAGFDNTGEPLILDRAAKWTSLTMTGVDAQHLESRMFQGEEICRAFGVIPIMVGFSDKAATYASAEQMFLAHSVHTARPLHRRFEASIRKNLLTKRERKEGYYPKFIDTELLRGAAKDRAEYYSKGISAGWLLRNEAREWEELDPVEGLSEPLSPVNMVVGNPEPPEDPASDAGDTPDDQQGKE